MMPRKAPRTLRHVLVTSRSCFNTEHRYRFLLNDSLVTPCPDLVQRSGRDDLGQGRYSGCLESISLLLYVLKKRGTSDATYHGMRRTKNPSAHGSTRVKRSIVAAGDGQTDRTQNYATSRPLSFRGLPIRLTACVTGSKGK